MLQICQAL